VLVAVLLVTCLAVTSCARKDGLFDGERAYQHVEAQCAIGPRIVGTEGGRQAAQYIARELDKLGWLVEVQEFTFRGVVGQNIVASRGSGDLYVIGAHYDTRPIADRDPTDKTQPVPGANDGASGVAVLLELARVLDLSKVDKQVWLAFFDAEDCGNINGWPFSVGAAEMAEHMSVRPKAVVVVDMVGDEDQRFMWETASNEELNRTLWSIAATLGYENEFIPRLGYSIMDDHVPFLQRGFLAVDIIDFDYPYWHTTQDTPDKVSAQSLQRIGRVLEKWLEE
jgi:Zn-dependent M28 family amino/carboxypeptidase